MTDPNHYDMIGFNEEKSLDTTFSSIDYEHSCFAPISPLFGGLFGKLSFHRRNITAVPSLTIKAQSNIIELRKCEK